MFAMGPSLENEAGVNRLLPARIKSVAFATMAYWFYRWDWGESIAFDGLTEAARTVDVPGVDDFIDGELHRWLDYEGSQQKRPPSRGGPWRQLIPAFSHIGRPEAAVEVIARFGTHMLSLPKRSGAIQLDEGKPYVFVDSLYGDPVTLALIADALSEPRYIELCVELTLGHCRLLQDEHTGLFSHFAGFDGTRNEIAWGRGIGWAALGLSDIIQHLDEGTPGRAEIMERYVLLTEQLLTAQDPGGWWHNIIDEPSSYPEASSTALIVAALTQSARAGIVGSEVSEAADRGWDVLKHRVDVNGHVVGVSYRPGVNTDPSRYEHTPTFGSYPWGQGAYLRAAAQRCTEDRAKP